MVKKKRQSKRTSLKDKYKVIRKVNEHRRKLRRKERADARNGVKPRMKKDPGIPNLWPFKEELLRKMEATRQRLEERKELAKATRKDLIAERRRMANEKNREIVSGLADNVARTAEFDERMKDEAAKAEAMMGDAVAATVRDAAESTRRAYYKEVRKVVDAADVILHVLDARDPMGCRSREVEEMVLDAMADSSDPEASRKRLVLVLNKIDLVPLDALQSWLKVLRRDFPTIAFKASTQEQKSGYGGGGRLNTRGGKGKGKGKGASKASAAAVATTRSQGSAVCVGSETLLQLLKNYSRNHKMKTAITVGVVGYPNVGKSSLINSLRRARAVSVSPVPGHTKVIQEVQLDSKVKLIDSPGVIFERAGKDGYGEGLLLKNCIGVEMLADPVSAALAIISRCKMEMLMSLYCVAKCTSGNELLLRIALRQGRLARGGIPDKARAARQLLRDWNSGKVPFYTLPTKSQLDEASGKDEARIEKDGASIKATYSQEFDLDALLRGADEEMETATRSGAIGTVGSGGDAALVIDMDMETEGDGDRDGGDDDVEEEDDDDDDDDDAMDEGEDEDEDDEEGEGWNYSSSSAAPAEPKRPAQVKAASEAARLRNRLDPAGAKKRNAKKDAKAKKKAARRAKARAVGGLNEGEDELEVQQGNEDDEQNDNDNDEAGDDYNFATDFF